MSSPRSRAFAWATIFAVLLLFVGRASADGEPAEGPAFDCGTLALYTLIRLEGHPVDLKALEARLPAPRDRGYSMEDLRVAARSFDLNLSGVHVLASDYAPDRPILAFIRLRPHGHYFVIRPVGHTGRLVQVLDSNREPYVLDATGLYNSPEWTGIALIPDRPNWPARFLIGFGLAVSLAAVLRSRSVRDMLRSTWTRLRPSPVPLASGGQD